MTPASLVIVVDRGGLKAYSVTEMPTRGASLRLVENFQITGSERALPFNVEASQHHMVLTKDWPALETETDHRIWKRLADRITRVVEAKSGEGWSFAATPAIHQAVVELLPVAIRERIVEHVPSDLMKTEPAKLQSHFRSLQPIRSTAVASTPALAKQAQQRRTRTNATAKH